jgi:hypothetical protein
LFTYVVLPFTGSTSSSSHAIQITGTPTTSAATTPIVTHPAFIRIRGFVL